MTREFTNFFVKQLPINCLQDLRHCQGGGLLPCPSGVFPEEELPLQKPVVTVVLRSLRKAVGLRKKGSLDEEGSRKKRGRQIRFTPPCRSGEHLRAQFPGSSGSPSSALCTSPKCSHRRATPVPTARSAGPVHTTPSMLPPSAGVCSATPGLVGIDRAQGGRWPRSPQMHHTALTRLPSGLPSVTITLSNLPLNLHLTKSVNNIYTVFRVSSATKSQYGRSRT